MSSAFLIAAIAAAGITTDWQPVSSKQADQDRSVLVRSEDASSESGSPRRHGVLKPPVDEPEIRAEDFAPIRHTVYQQPYSPQNYSTQAAIEDGFRQYNSVATEQRKSIGSELAKGTQKVLDETGRAFRNTGEMVEGTAKNIGDGLRSLVSPGVTPTAGVAAAPQSGYQPYAYNQQTPLPSYNPAAASPAPPAGNYAASQGAPQASVLTQPQAASQQPYASVGGASPTGQQQGAWNASTPPVPGATAPNYGQSQQQAPAAQQPPNPSQYSAPDLHHYAGGSGQQSSGGNRAFVDFGGSDTSHNEPYAPIPGVQTVSNPTGAAAQQPPAGQQNYQQNYSPGSAAPAPSLGNGNDSWPDWPTNAQTAASQQPSQPPAQQQSQYNPYPYGAPPAGYGAAAGGQAQNAASQNPAGWANGGSIDSPYNLPPTQATNVSQTGAGQAGVTDPEDDRTTKTWFALVTVAAIGSIAWNFYLGMNYVDARNKYRAALRRSGRAYSEALDDM